MLKSRIFHANALDKHPKLGEQFNVFLATLSDDALVSVNTTEVGPSSSNDFYSFTVLVVYKEDSPAQ